MNPFRNLSIKQSKIETIMLTPEITVATVIEKDNRFLLVEEETEYGVLLNQPAGHLEEDESLIEAAIRETLEETACEMMPDALIGVYLLQYTLKNNEKVSFIRFTFTGKIGVSQNRPLDPDILRTVWMTYDEIAACPERHRSSLVLKSIDDYRKGQRMPLSVLSTFFVERK